MLFYKRLIYSNEELTISIPNPSKYPFSFIINTGQSYRPVYQLVLHMNRQEEFIQLLESNKGILYKVANAYCKDTEDRKDLVQEMAYQLWKSFDKYNAQYKLSTWIYRIALNVAISSYRKGMVRKGHDLSLSGSILDFPDTESLEESEQHLLQLQRFIAELKEMDKAVMLLYLEEKSHKEIADIIGISESNVGTKISRIKAVLTQKFSNFKK